MFARVQTGDATPQQWQHTQGSRIDPAQLHELGMSVHPNAET
jgi:hypothetical protein